MYNPLFKITSKPWLKAAASPPHVRASSDAWFFDLRTNGWFRDSFANANYFPVAVDLFDGDDPNDRVLLIGSEDGYIRYFDVNSAKDDNTVFTSQVTLGPLSSQNGLKNLIISEVQTRTDLNGSTISFELLSGDTAEIAKNTEANTFTGSDGTLTTGYSQVVNPLQRGYYHYIKLGTNAAATRWALEQVRMAGLEIVSDRSRLGQ